MKGRRDHPGRPWPDRTYQHAYAGGARRQCADCRGIIVWYEPQTKLDRHLTLVRSAAGYWRHIS